MKAIPVFLALLAIFASCATPQANPQPTPTIPPLPPTQEESFTSDAIPADRFRLDLFGPPSDLTGLERYLDPTLFPVTPAPARQRARVVRVIDGDTIEVEADGRMRRVNYLGVSVPEHYALEASERNRQLVEGREVVLERDETTFNLDRDGSLLRYVRVGGEVVNAILVREGYARAWLSYPNASRMVELLTLQAQAISEGLGIWKAPRQ
ncbi:MAG: thermonuclease family protein [Chloroflexi bacterium]|nr:thermonuclease family protein [Chloroflexota bacterium]